MTHIKMVHDMFDKSVTVYTDQTDFESAILQAGYMAISANTLDLRIHDGKTEGGLFSIMTTLTPGALVKYPDAKTPFMLSQETTTP